MPALHSLSQSDDVELEEPDDGGAGFAPDEDSFDGLDDSPVEPLEDSRVEPPEDSDEELAAESLVATLGAAPDVPSPLAAARLSLR